MSPTLEMLLINPHLAAVQTPAPATDDRSVGRAVGAEAGTPLDQFPPQYSLRRELPHFGQASSADPAKVVRATAGRRQAAWAVIDGRGRSAYDEGRCFTVVNNRLWEMKRGEKIADFGFRIAD